MVLVPRSRSVMSRSIRSKQLPPPPSCTARLGDIDLTADGVENLRSEFKEESLGRVMLKDTAKTLHIIVLGDAVVNANIHATGPSSICQVIIEVTGHLSVHRLRWNGRRGHSESPSVRLSIRCDALRLTEQICAWSEGPPRVDIQCENDMICGLRGNRQNLSFPARICAVSNEQKGGDITINLGGKLIVEEQDPNEQPFQLLRDFTEDEDDEQRSMFMPNWVHAKIHAQLRTFTPYLKLVSVGYGADGYQCGQIRINTAVGGTESADWRFVRERDWFLSWTYEYLFHVSDDLQCVASFTRLPADWRV